MDRAGTVHRLPGAKRPTCRHEDGICKSSHIIASTFNNALAVNRAAGSEKVLLYCLPGLDTLQDIAERCVISQVNLLGMEVFGGESVLTISRPNKTINCDHTFGEIYVILSCAGYCEDSICPL